MKEIIYLDTGMLHSYIAQHYDGLPTETSNERGEEVKDVNEQDHGYKSGTSIEARIKSGKFEIPAFIKTPEGEIKVRWQPGEFMSEKAVISQTETGKEIISKQLHDNALETFENYLENENILYDINDTDIEGKYVKLTSSFKIIDFNYLKKILQTDKLIEFMFMKQDEELKSIKDEVKAVQEKQLKARQQALLNQVSSDLNSKKAEMRGQFQFIEKSMDYLTDILPTNSFIVMENTIAPLKDDYLREKANELMFKYGTSSTNIYLTMVGKVTNKIDSIELPNFDKDPFFSFPKILNMVLNPLGVVNEGDLIISPVAIYFE
ncbi:DUF6414 family protein [Metabacillus bambusae]|uniref:Uncharacterized protein n=1 Tax=Metabacillus bambusae TaxID=2795218 RepID=A0ABS3NBL7_9BACI|nr:hypothetical protein [Metabacillus bambusae]MBO1515676.1 hypothetical protein [Metabacillus bambusae]